VSSASLLGTLRGASLSNPSETEAGEASGMYETGVMTSECMIIEIEGLLLSCEVDTIDIAALITDRTKLLSIKPLQRRCVMLPMQEGDGTS